VRSIRAREISHREHLFRVKFSSVATALMVPFAKPKGEVRTIMETMLRVELKRV